MSTKKKGPLRFDKNGDWILPQTSDELQEIIEHVLENAEEIKARRRGDEARAVSSSPCGSEEEKQIAPEVENVSSASAKLPQPTDLNLWRQTHARSIKTSAITSAEGFDEGRQ